MSSQHVDEVNAGQRFQFGRNWARFLKTINSNRVATAESSLAALLDVRSLAGRTFLDVGSGSGLFSLAARRMGACVRSFDYDLPALHFRWFFQMRDPTIESTEITAPIPPLVRAVLLAADVALGLWNSLQCVSDGRFGRAFLVGYVFDVSK